MSGLIGFLGVGMGVNTSGLGKGFNTAAGQVRTFSGQVQGAGSSLGGLYKAAAAGAAGLGIAAGIGKAVTAASSLSSAFNKTETIFGDAGGAITSEASRMAEQIGVVESEYINAAAGFGATFKGVGKSQEESAALGNTLAQVAIDLARFDDVADSVGFDAIKAGLRGEFDPLEQFRIYLTADAIAAEALSSGLIKNKKDMTEAAKKQATLNLIMRQSKDAQGAAAREAGEVGSQLAALGGRATNLAAMFGLAIEPVTSSILGLAGGAMVQLADAFQQAEPFIASWSTWIGSGITTAIGSAVGWFRTAAGSVTDFVATSPAVQAFGSTVSGVFTWVKDTALVFWSTLKDVAGALVEMATTPEMQAFAGYVGEAFTWVADKVGQVMTWVGGVVRGTFEAIGVVARNWRAIMQEAGVRAMGAIINVGETITWVGTTIGTFLDWFGTHWRTIFADAFNATIQALTNLGTNFVEFGRSAYDWIASGFTKPFQFQMTPVMAGFGAQTPAMKVPELNLSSVDDQVQQIRAGVAADEARRLEVKTAEEAVGATPPDSGPAPKPAVKTAVEAAASAAAKTPEVKLAGAAAAGSTEAYSTLAKFQAGGSGGDGMKNLQKVNETQRDSQIRSENHLRKLVEGGLKLSAYTI